ncbi:MAG: hypothetical protein IT479_12700 [Xanthomonadales bacterium]|nr:hypothetical protein [Xanthomonadales bacterium]
MSQSLLDRAREALSPHDPAATVELADGALRVASVLPASTVVGLLRAAAIPTAESERGDCCGGCCGGASRQA